MARALGVGIIGASAERGWAKLAHGPAVQQLTGLEVVAVASGSSEKADAAAKAFGAQVGYADGRDLIRDPNVDIVTIAVKVPDHRELVLAVAIGLQTRVNPALLRARELVASGAVGRPLTARILSSTAAFGPKVESAMAFAENADNGVTLVTIQGAHTVDFAIALLGPWVDLNALSTIQYPDVWVGDSLTKQARTTPDYLLVQAHGAGDVGVSIEVAGGRPPHDVPFRMEVTGEDGLLVLAGGAMRGFQSGRLTLSLQGKLQIVGEGEMAGMPAEASNVAAMYAALRNDIVFGTKTAPDFSHAMRLSKLVDDILLSAQTGMRKKAEDWPF